MKLKLFQFIFSIFAFCHLLATVNANDADDFQLDEFVYVINEKNFDRFINQNEFTVVFFYAPWCGHCVRMKPYYHEAAKLLAENKNDEFRADQEIKLIKVDATVEQSLATRFGLDGYPTLKIIRKGQTYDYEGPRQEGQDIAEYLIKEASSSWRPPVSPVNVLTESNFTDWVNAQEVSLVEFYAPNCVHCKRLAPNFEKAAKQLAKEKNPIPLAKVDASVELELSKTYNIQGYPTLLIFRKGRHYEYKGGRDAHEMVEFMLKSRSSRSKQVNTFNQFNVNVKKPTEVYLLGLFDNEQQHLFNVFNDFASKYPDDFQIFHTFKSAVNDDKFKQLSPRPPVPSIVVYYHDLVPVKKEPRFRVFSKVDASVNEIEEFVMRNSLPLVGHLGEKNRKLIYDNVRPLCYIFYDVDAELKSHIVYVRDKVAPIARKHQDRIRFVIANETENSGLLRDFHLEESQSETNVVCINENGKRFIYDKEMDGLDEEEIEEFVAKFSSGKLKPFVKSQKAPKDNAKRLIKIVVGSTFESIVMNDEEQKHVVLAFAPPKADEFNAAYEKVAKQFAKNANLLFAKFDFTVNDFPDDVFKPNRAPTLFFVPIGRRNSPVLFDKNDAESPDDLAEFVYEQLLKTTTTTTTTTSDSDDKKKATDVKEDL